LSLALVIPALAAPDINLDIPVSGQVFNPCNGEIVTFSGVDHFTAHLTLTTSGGFHLGEHDNVHVTATGDLGNSYIGNQEDDLVLNGTVGVEETSPFSFAEIGQGSAPNFDEHEILHITVTPNGMVSAFFDHFTATCHG
jgi:hypothetical protein